MGAKVDNEVLTLPVWVSCYDLREAKSPHPFVKIFDSFLLPSPESLSNIYLVPKSLKPLPVSLKERQASQNLLDVAVGSRRERVPRGLKGSLSGLSFSRVLVSGF